MRFIIVNPGVNCFNERIPGLVSVDKQTYTDWVCVVTDDNSDDQREKDFLEEWCERDSRWVFRGNNTRKGALCNQWESVQAVNPHDDDVIVFLDGDDRLGVAETLELVAAQYKAGNHLTYGGYRPLPDDPMCHIPTRYPDECEEARDYRNAYKWLIKFGHLRTVQYKVFKNLDPSTDLKWPDGGWFMCAGDTAVMLPCLEMVGDKYHCFSHTDPILYYYTSNSPNADWRVRSDEIEATHRYIFSNIPRKPVVV